MRWPSKADRTPRRPRPAQQGLYLTDLGERTLLVAQGCLARAGERTCTGLQASEQQTLLHLLCKLNASAALERAAAPDTALAEAL